MYVATSYTHFEQVYSTLYNDYQQTAINLSFLWYACTSRPINNANWTHKVNYYRHLIYKHEVIQDVCQYVAIVYIAKGRFLHTIASYPVAIFHSHNNYTTR